MMNDTNNLSNPTNPDSLHDTSVDIESAIGLTIQDLRLHDDTHIDVEFTNGTTLTLAQGQSCCECRYFTTDDTLVDARGSVLYDITLTSMATVPLSPATVLSPKNDDDDDDDGWGEEHDYSFLRIYTSAGVFVFCAHNHHNGWYAGFEILTEWV